MLVRTQCTNANVQHPSSSSHSLQLSFSLSEEIKLLGRKTEISFIIKMNLCVFADNTKSSMHAIFTYYIIAGIIIIAKCTISSIHQKLSSPGERKQNVRIFNFSDAEFSHLPLLCSSLVGWAPPILDAGEKVALHKTLACSGFAAPHARYKYKYKYRQKFKYRNLLFIRCLVAHVCKTHT